MHTVEQTETRNSCDPMGHEQQKQHQQHATQDSVVIITISAPETTMILYCPRMAEEFANSSTSVPTPRQPCIQCQKQQQQNIRLAGTSVICANLRVSNTGSIPLSSELFAHDGLPPQPCDSNYKQNNIYNNIYAAAATMQWHHFGVGNCQ